MCFQMGLYEAKRNEVAAVQYYDALGVRLLPKYRKPRKLQKVGPEYAPNNPIIRCSRGDV